MNKDGTHLIYIQPITGGKSKHSKTMNSGAVLARTHVPSPGVHQNVRDALKKSARDSASLVVAKK